VHVLRLVIRVKVDEEFIIFERKKYALVVTRVIATTRNSTESDLSDTAAARVSKQQTTVVNQRRRIIIIHAAFRTRSSREQLFSNVLADCARARPRVFVLYTGFSHAAFASTKDNTKNGLFDP